MLFIFITLNMGAFSRRMNDRTGKASALVCATKKDLEDAGFILKAGELMRLRGRCLPKGQETQNILHATTSTERRA